MHNITRYCKPNNKFIPAPPTPSLIFKQIKDDRLKEFKIYVGNIDGPSTPFRSSDYEVCAKMCDEQFKARGSIYTCHTRPKGRHVAIAHYSTAITSLNLCEVEVYPDTTNGK